MTGGSESGEGAQTTLNPNSALYWLSAARTAAEYADAIRVPVTRVVEFDFMESLSLLGRGTNKDFPWEELTAAANDIGYPVFIRSDLTSAKHRGIDSIRAEDDAALSRVVVETIKECADELMRPAAFLVRQWIAIESRFTAFDGLPIGIEYRVFARPDEVICQHYYWQAGSIKRPAVPDEVAEKLRRRMAAVSPHFGVRRAAKAAARVANERDDCDQSSRAWCVDFALSESGDWYLIDMALAEDSWHPDECAAKAGLEAVA